MNLKKEAHIVLSQFSMTLEGIELGAAVTEGLVLDILGKPDRVEQGTPPAPAGHRNNEVYFFDSYGIYWIRHHKTLLMTTLGLVLHPDLGNPLQRHTRVQFSGWLQLLDSRIDCRTTVNDLTEAVRDRIRPRLGTWWAGHVGGHDVTFQVAVSHGSPGAIMDMEIGFGKPLLDDGGGDAAHSARS